MYGQAFTQFTPFQTADISEDINYESVISKVNTLITSPSQLIQNERCLFDIDDEAPFKDNYDLLSEYFQQQGCSGSTTVVTEVVSSNNNNNTRAWTTVFQDPVIGDGVIEILLKTRREKSITVVPETIYSSLKYDIRIVATGEFLRDLPFLLAKISIVNAVTLKPIENCTKGENETALTRAPNGPINEMKGIIRVHFDSSLSYSHGRQTVCLKLNFFKNDALYSPIITKQSLPVKVYARKPNKKSKPLPTNSAAAKQRALVKNKEFEKKKSGIKKAFKSGENTTTNATATTSENTTTSATAVSEFERKLDKLVQLGENFTHEDRQRITGILFSKLGFSFSLLKQ